MHEVSGKSTFPYLVIDLLIDLFICVFIVVSQQSGILSNLGTNISSPNSESDNHALLDEKEDSYFSEIRNFISNSELNQACSSSEKRYERAQTHAWTEYVLKPWQQTA